VKNGTLETVEKLGKYHMLVRLDEGRLVKVSFKDGVKFTYGYAMSIHKSEGCTFDKTYVALDPLMNTVGTLVSMTRHREDVKVFISKRAFRGEKEFFYKLGRSEGSLNLADYG
jgi:ATP-dependent exoDNAse (exonuclease V) alpha subunit